MRRKDKNNNLESVDELYKGLINVTKMPVKQ